MEIRITKHPFIQIDAKGQVFFFFLHLGPMFVNVITATSKVVMTLNSEVLQQTVQ